MTEQSREPGSLRENLFAAETFATDAASFSILSGNVISISFASTRWNQEANAFEGVITQRIVMPLTGAQNLALGLHDFLEKNGFSPTKAITGDATPQ